MNKLNLKRVLIPALIFYLTIFIFLQFAHGQQENKLFEEDQCIVCHIEEEILPEHFNKNDIHLQAGLSCAGCHGGDPTSDDMDESMDPDNGFIGVPSKKEIPKFCGKCHSNINIMREFQPRIPTDQVDQYYTSVHGEKLKKGDKKVADCTSCHTAHSIFPAKDSRSTVYDLNVPITCKKCHADPIYMKEYGIPTDQFMKYSESVHGKMLLENQDTGAPACNDCHGNHGAMPPGITSVTHVCGTCHVNNMQYFSKTKMAREFEKLEIHGCEACHGNHDVKKPFDNMVGTSDKSVCTNCHDKAEKGYNVAEKINGQLTRLVASYDSAVIKQNKIQVIGMDDVEINYLLQESHQSLIQARTLVHTFDPEKVGEKTNEGINKAKIALDLSIKEIKDYNSRRRGFGIATLFITVLAIALFLKIREMEK
jgi:predicted CXXCH cytochrome family protein